MYRGPEIGQGISVYHNGELQGNNTQGSNANIIAAPSGVLKIGKMFEKPTEVRYAKLIMDELLIWNKQLSLTEIREVMQLAQSTADFSLNSPFGRK